MDFQDFLDTVDPSTLSYPFTMQAETLGDKLRAAIHQSPSGGFIPISELYSLITKDTINEELRQVLNLSDESRSVLARKVLGSSSSDLGARNLPTGRLKVFGILALIGKSASIASFISENVSDEALPVSVRAGLGNLGHEVFANNNPDVPLNCFLDWSDAEIAAFEASQWLTLSPVFLDTSGPADVEFLEFPSKTPFPFVGDAVARLPPRVGGSSTVTNVNIHPAHFKFEDDGVSTQRHGQMIIRSLTYCLELDTYICCQETRGRKKT